MKINVTKGEVLFSNSFQTKIFIDKSDFSIINKDYSIVSYNLIRILHKTMKKSS